MNINKLGLTLTFGLLLTACGGGRPTTAEPAAAGLTVSAASTLPSGTVACFYEHINYQGASFCASAGSSWVGSSWNDRISSVKVQNGQSIQLFSDINYGGRLLTLTGDNADLRGNSFNDVVSSFKVSTSAPSDIDTKCTPTVTVQVDSNVDQTQAARINNLNPQALVQKVAHDVCRTLYRSVQEAFASQRIILHIVNQVGGAPAWTSQGSPDSNYYLNTDYTRKVSSADFQREVTGVTAHELTHAYQYYGNGYGNNVGLVEGIADYVRFTLGYVPAGATPSKYGNWNDGYRTTAFFLQWVEKQRPSFVHDLNQDMRSSSFNVGQSFVNLTGKTPDQLWTDYKNSF